MSITTDGLITTVTLILTWNPIWWSDTRKLHVRLAGWICHPVSVWVMAEVKSVKTLLAPETPQQSTQSLPLTTAWWSDCVIGCPAVTMKGQSTSGDPDRQGHESNLWILSVSCCLLLSPSAADRASLRSAESHRLQLHSTVALKGTQVFGNWSHWSAHTSSPLKSESEKMAPVFDHTVQYVDVVISKFHLTPGSAGLTSCQFNTDFNNLPWLEDKKCSHSQQFKPKVALKNSYQ